MRNCCLLMAPSSSFSRQAKSIITGHHKEDEGVMKRIKEFLRARSKERKKEAFLHHLLHDEIRSVWFSVFFCCFFFSVASRCCLSYYYLFSRRRSIKGISVADLFFTAVVVVVIMVTVVVAVGWLVEKNLFLSSVKAVDSLSFLSIESLNRKKDVFLLWIEEDDQKDQCQSWNLDEERRP